MKRLLSAILLLAFTTLATLAENELFKQCENIKNVTTTYIGPSMLRYAATSCMDYGISPSATNNLDDITVINADDKISADQVRKHLKQYESRLKYNLIMKTKDDDEETRILQGQGRDKKYELMVVKDEGDEISIVILTSTTSFDEMKNVFMPGLFN